MRPLTLLASGVVLLGLQMGSATADNCDNVVDQAAMNACTQQSLLEANAELNRLYGQIVARFGDQPETMKLLVAAQRAWIAYRDAECELSSSGAIGGSAYPMIVMMCREQITKDRIEDFRNYLLCEEGDLSCPVPPTAESTRPANQ